MIGEKRLNRRGKQEENLTTEGTENTEKRRRGYNHKGTKTLKNTLGCFSFCLSFVPW
jgi:hypothetical protein